jgi:phospholipase/carboxylesterase
MSRDNYIFRERAGSDARAPLLFLFHGTGGDEDQFFDLGGELLPGAHLLAPRGDVSEHGALRYFRRTGEGRYDMADLATRTEKMIAFIRAHIGGRQPAGVFGLGYSNGANILASVLFSAPELFDGAVLLHPLIPFTSPPAPGLAGRRILVTAGRQDPIAPVPATEALAAWLEAQSADLTLAWQPGGHALTPPELAAARAFLTAAHSRHRTDRHP